MKVDVDYKFHKELIDGEELAEDEELTDSEELVEEEISDDITDESSEDEAALLANNIYIYMNFMTDIELSLVTGIVIDKVSIVGISGNIIKQDVGSAQAYVVKKTPADSDDESVIVYSEDASGFQAKFNQEQTEIEVEIKKVDANAVKGNFSIVDKSVEGRPVPATYNVVGRNPVS